MHHCHSRAFYLWDTSIVVSTAYSLEWHEEGCGNYVILHHANVFSLLRTIFYDIKNGLSNNSYSFETLSQGFNIGLITYTLPCNRYNFSLVFPHFLISLLIFMNMQMR